MAIVWEKRESGGEWELEKVPHEGLVMGPKWTREERVMSDIYADVTYITVWDPKACKPTDVALAYHFDLGAYSRGLATVDFDETRPDYVAYLAAREEAARKAEVARLKAEAEARVERAKAKVLKLEKGAEVVVTSGRKVPRGTRGTVIWTGDGNYGPRVGIKDASGEAHWTAESNVTVVLPGKDPSYVPPGGWEALAEGVRAKEEADRDAMASYLETVPRKGDTVTHLESGVVGRVFWVKGTRLGMKRKGAPKSEDPIWVSAWGVRKADGSVCGKPPGWVERDKKPAPAPAPAPKAAPPAGFTDVGLGAEEASGPSEKLLAMPAPFCNIRSLVEAEDGSWKALDASGALVVILPRATADSIAALL
jgi:hypothetical protein